MAAWLARRAARRLASELRSRGPGPWPLSSSTVLVLGVPSGDQSRGFCSVRRFAGDSAAAAAVEEPENGLAAGDLQVSVHSYVVVHTVGRLLLDMCVLQNRLVVVRSTTNI